MKALYHRARTGEGCRIDVSMFRSAVSWMVAPIVLDSVGERITRRGSTHQFFAPVAVFSVRDGHVYVAVGSDPQWAALAGLPAFTGVDRSPYATNAGRIADGSRLQAALAERFARLTTAEALGLLRGAGVPVSAVAALGDVVTDPLVAPTLVRVRDPRTGITIVLPPPPVAQPPALTFPPRLGEHTDVVLTAAGCDAGRLADLRRRAIV
jgi:crotonobetainyl-CoA:carnitine CoA-transferase CaiB-like acyl-CoA transferase